MLKYFTNEYYSYLSSGKKKSFMVEKDIKTRTTFFNREDLKNVFVLDPQDTTAGLCLLNISLFLLGGLSKHKVKGDLATNLQGGLFIISLIIFSIQKAFERYILSDILFVVLLFISCMLPFLLLELNGCFNNIVFFPICVMFYFTRYHLRNLFILDSFLILTILIINVSINSSTIDIYIFLFLLIAFSLSILFYRYLYYFSKVIYNSSTSQKSMILMFPYITEYQEICFLKLADILLDLNNYMYIKWNIFCENIPKVHLRNEKETQNLRMISSRLSNKFYTLKNQKMFSIYPPYYCLKVLYHKKLYLITSAIEKKKKEFMKLYSNENKRNIHFLIEIINLQRKSLDSDSHPDLAHHPKSIKRDEKSKEKKKIHTYQKKGINYKEFSSFQNITRDKLNQNDNIKNGTTCTKGSDMGRKKKKKKKKKTENIPQSYEQMGISKQHNQDVSAVHRLTHGHKNNIHKSEKKKVEERKCLNEANESVKMSQRGRREKKKIIKTYHRQNNFVEGHLKKKADSDDEKKKQMGKSQSNVDNDFMNKNSKTNKINVENLMGPSERNVRTDIDNLQMDTSIGGIFSNIIAKKEAKNITPYREKIKKRKEKKKKITQKNVKACEQMFESKYEADRQNGHVQGSVILQCDNMKVFKNKKDKKKTIDNITQMVNKHKVHTKNDMEAKNVKKKFIKKKEHGFEFFFAKKNVRMEHKICDKDITKEVKENVNCNERNDDPSCPSFTASAKHRLNVQLGAKFRSHLNDKKVYRPNNQNNYMNMYMSKQNGKNERNEQSKSYSDQSANYSSKPMPKKMDYSEENFSSSSLKYYHDNELAPEEKIVFINFSCLFYVCIYKIKLLLKYIENVNSVVQGNYFRQGISPKQDHLLAFVDQKIERYYILWSNSVDFVYHVENYISHIILIFIFHLSSVFVRIAPIQLSASYSLFKMASFSTIFMTRFLLTPPIFALIIWPIIKTRSLNPRTIFKIKMRFSLLSLFILVLSIFDYLWTIFLVYKNFWRLDKNVLMNLERTYNCSMFSLSGLFFFVPIFYFLIMQRLKSMWYMYIIWLSIINVIYWSFMDAWLSGLKMNISLMTLIVMCIVFIIRPFEMVKRDIFCRCVLPYILFLDDVLCTIDSEKRLKYLYFQKVGVQARSNNFDTFHG
ncbi:hypothetical protein, conserved [Plasmodium gonderi]|uniref:Uncharacterized protein n=1 Tax=Plasmodium gonderi TaxID=77519 RepID=A0A1Y1JD74_PLAGO|nr:hypothetical protein, conserved [Plasmodium gonderi]GAW80469.1 hypothetical protein, conserved [Plasmodium gonderi]